MWNASLGGYVSQHGPGFSPMVHDGLVFVNVDDDEHAELVAFDAKTGDKKWIATASTTGACYSTPFILKRGDRPEELILGTTHVITSYDPATGKMNWEYAIAVAGREDAAAGDRPPGLRGRADRDVVRRRRRRRGT